ncbi:MAG: hypothetical protein A4E35_01328 [Methanoregula sp. PtaU1.Bin051]|nr:MAG: hypothetical protein A4E35_01328 [Methanoregula sp. PtaU1.Bin051]
MTNAIEKKDPPSDAGWSTGTKIAIGVVALIVVITFFAIITLTVIVLDTQNGGSFPYSTSYRVTLPDGEPVTIGATRILVVTYGDEVLTEVDGVKEKLVVGQERIISPHYAQVSTMGLPVMDTDFQITLKYLGTSGKNALFDLTIRTSDQIPEILLRRLIPPGMNAVPV